MSAVNWLRQKSHAWWYVFTQSVFNRNYYAQLGTSRFSLSLKFIFVFFLLYMTMWSAIVAVVVANWIPQLQRQLPRFSNELINTYPKGAVFTVNNGSLRTNLDHPFVVVAPQQATSDQADPSMDRTNLLVVDEHANVSDYAKKDTIILVSKNAVVVPSQSNSTGYESFRLSEMLKKDVTITQNSFTTQIRSLAAYVDSHMWNLYPWLVFVAAIGLLTVGTAAVLAFHLLYFFLLAAYVYAISRFIGRMTFWHSYRFTMHAFVAPFMVDALLKRIIGDYYSPLYFLLLFSAWILYLLQPAPTKRVS